jgi:hypothetical protein
MRAYGFYLMYVVVAFLVIFLIVGFISPKHPQPANWPEWTLNYVLEQLESLQTLELDALCVRGEGAAAPLAPCLCGGPLSACVGCVQDALCVGGGCHKPGLPEGCMCTQAGVGVDSLRQQGDLRVLPWCSPPPMCLLRLLARVVVHHGSWAPCLLVCAFAQLLLAGAHAVFPRGGPVLGRRGDGALATGGAGAVQGPGYVVVVIVVSK